MHKFQHVILEVGWGHATASNPSMPWETTCAPENERHQFWLYNLDGLTTVSTFFYSAEDAL